MMQKSPAHSTGTTYRPAKSETILLCLVLLAIVGGGSSLWWLVSQEPSLPKEQQVGSERSIDAEAALQEAIERADKLDPGWRFTDLQARRAEIPDAKNGALAVLDAGKTLSVPWTEEKLAGDLIQLGAVTPISSKQNAALRAALAKDAPALREASRLADLPLGRYPVTFKEGPWGTPLPHLDPILAVQEILFCDVLRRTHDGDLDGALRSDRALLNAGRSIGDEPMSHSQLIRNLIYLAATHALERILAHGQPSAEALKQTQELFTDEANQTLLLLAARSMRAGRKDLMERLLDPKADLASLKDVSDTGEIPLNDLVTAFRSNSLVPYPKMVKRIDPWLLSYLTDFVEIVKLPQNEQAERLQSFLAKAASCPKPGEFLIPNIGSYVQRFNVNRTFVRCSAVALALERYRQSKGTWPESLSSLAPAFLADVPLDPFDGKPLRYRKYPEGVVVYSIGTDGKDNEGKFDSLNTYREGTDIGIRLWNVDKRTATKR